MQSEPAEIVIRRRRRQGPLRRALAIGIMLVFVALRIATSPPPTEIDSATHVGAQPRPPSPAMTAAGVTLMAALVVTAEPAIAFAFILCDMGGFGAFFDLDQWGIAGAFKFRDLEMAMLLAGGALLWLTRTHHVRERRTRLGIYLSRLPWIITGIAVVYTLFTLRYQDLGTTIRYSRQLYVWLLLLVSPQFIRTRRDLGRVVAVLVAYTALAAILYIGQSVAPAQTILRYSAQITTAGQTRTWAASVMAIFLGGTAIFAYQLQARRSTTLLWIVFAACSVAIAMTQARMLTATYVAAIGTMLLHRAIVTHRIGLAVRVALTAAAVLVACTAILWSVNRLDPLLNVWSSRIGELELDVRAHAGSWTSRTEMFKYLPLVVERNGGGFLASCFGMGLRALTPADLAPMIFWGVISPPIWADNGLAGITFTFGYVGLCLLFVLVGSMVWRLRVQFARFRDPLCRSLTFAAAFYFATVLPYMFFSSSFMGVWDDALAVIVLLMVVERSAATQLVPRVAS